VAIKKKTDFAAALTGFILGAVTLFLQPRGRTQPPRDKRRGA